MAGNSQRRGAMRKPGSKKGAVVGSGGQKSKQLQGKGPTPPASARKGHSAARKAAASERRASQSRSSSGGPGAGGAGGTKSASSRRPAKESAEVVSGRNPVVEALRAGVPASALYVASRIDSDDRVREALKLAADSGIALLEAQRTELDRLAGGVHQGVALQVPPYVYAHPDDLL